MRPVGLTQVQLCSSPFVCWQKVSNTPFGQANTLLQKAGSPRLPIDGQVLTSRTGVGVGVGFGIEGLGPPLHFSNAPTVVPHLASPRATAVSQSRPGLTRKNGVRQLIALMPSG